MLICLIRFYIYLYIFTLANIITIFYASLFCVSGPAYALIYAAHNLI